MGNARSNYERHEDDEQQQRIVIGKEFHLVLGQVNLTKRKKYFLNHQKLSSSSSSNSTIGSSSSSSDQQNSSVSLIQFDIPTSILDSNEFEGQTLIQYLFQQQPHRKELSHLFKIPINPNQKLLTKSLPTQQIAGVYYDHLSITKDLNIEKISLLNENELEKKFEKFSEKNILSIYPLKSQAYIIYTKNSSIHNKYKLIRSTTMSKTVLENFEWLHPFIDYSNLGYRLCGIIPYNNSSDETSFTIYWIFEQNENLQYDYCLIEYQVKSFSINKWKSFLNLMSKKEWKLVTTFDYNQKKKKNEQIYFLLFFQRLKY